MHHDDEMLQQTAYAKKRRIGAKTAPIEVPAFPLRPLLTHEKYKVLQHKLKHSKQKQAKEARMVRTESVRLLSLNHVREEEGDSEYELPTPTQVRTTPTTPPPWLATKG